MLQSLTYMFPLALPSQPALDPEIESKDTYEINNCRSLCTEIHNSTTQVYTGKNSPYCISLYHTSTLSLTGFSFSDKVPVGDGDETPPTFPTLPIDISG